ncbi:MAG: acyltransferase [Planctomycetales bacterium]|nr:acyltransferase [Planctomycetales bacterium]
MTILTYSDATIVAEHKQAFSRSTRSDRPSNSSNWVDAVRVVASYFIIWIHVPRSSVMIQTTVIGRFAVPFFAFAAVFFAAQNGLQKRDRSIGKMLASRFHRIYVPFLLWSGIYFAFKVVKLALLPDQPNDFPGWEFFVEGTAYHLWFLPFVFLTTIVAFSAARLVRGRDSKNAIVVAVTLAVSVCLINSDAWSTTDGLIYMWQTLPAAFAAFAFAMFVHRAAVGNLKRVASPVGFAVAVACMLLLVSNRRNVMLENICGVALFVWAYWKTNTQLKSKMIQRLAPLAFGIYLSHLLFVKVIEAVTQKLGLVPSAWLDVVMFAAVAIGSTLMCGTYNSVRSRLRPARFGWLLP